MLQQSFGGPWTEDKLERLRRYLVEYMKIFRAGKWASKYKTIYVDAFAGTGYRTRRQKTAEGLPLFPEHEDEDAVSFFEGSASLALALKQGFDEHVFIELDPSKVSELELLRSHFPARKVDIRQGDANQRLREFCNETDWRKYRAVVFLDPHAMEVNWSTIECIGKTAAVDLWLLFPLSAVNRLLTRAGRPPDSWGNNLTRLFGTDQWSPAFYPTRTDETLFGTEVSQLKQVDFRAIGNFFVSRLKTTFSKVAEEPRVLFSSRNVPLFLFCFAAANPGAGGDIALRIARHILKM